MFRYDSWIQGDIEVSSDGIAGKTKCPIIRSENEKLGSSCEMGGVAVDILHMMKTSDQVKQKSEEYNWYSLILFKEGDKEVFEYLETTPYCNEHATKGRKGKYDFWSSTQNCSFKLVVFSEVQKGWETLDMATAKKGSCLIGKGLPVKAVPLKLKKTALKRDPEEKLPEKSKAQNKKRCSFNYTPLFSKEEFGMMINSNFYVDCR